MTFNKNRSNIATRKIGKIPGVRVTWHYCDKRAGNENRHKLGVSIGSNSSEVMQQIEFIIKENFPESFPHLYKGEIYPEERERSAFIQIVWRSKREMYVDEFFKVVLEDKGRLIENVAG